MCSVSEGVYSHIVGSHDSEACVIQQALGHLLLTLTCMGSGLRPSLDNCMAHYSMDLTRIISALLASPEGDW